MSKEAKTKREFSAGGVVYKGERWLVGKHSGYHKWVLPKGLVDEGEKMEEAAVREVEEECGIKARIVGKIPEPERYVYMMEGVRIFKQVVYFLMEYVSGEIKDHGWEMEAVEWLGFEEAKERLNYRGAKGVLEKAKQLREEKERQLRLV